MNFRYFDNLSSTTVLLYSGLDAHFWNSIALPRLWSASIFHTGTACCVKLRRHRLGAFARSARRQDRLAGTWAKMSRLACSRARGLRGGPFVFAEKTVPHLTPEEPAQNGRDPVVRPGPASRPDSGSITQREIHPPSSKQIARFRRLWGGARTSQCVDHFRFAIYMK